MYRLEVIFEPVQVLFFVYLCFYLVHSLSMIDCQQLSPSDLINESTKVEDIQQQFSLLSFFSSSILAKLFV